MYFTVLSCCRRNTSANKYDFIFITYFLITNRLTLAKVQEMPSDLVTTAHTTHFYFTAIYPVHHTGKPAQLRPTNIVTTHEITSNSSNTQ